MLADFDGYTRHSIKDECAIRLKLNDIKPDKVYPLDPRATDEGNKSDGGSVLRP